MYKRRQNPFDCKVRGEDYRRDNKMDDVLEEDIAPISGRLVLFRSRDMPHEVLENRKKRFAVSYYIPGPAGPGDQADGKLHTPV